MGSVHSAAIGGAPAVVIAEGPPRGEGSMFRVCTVLSPVFISCDHALALWGSLDPWDFFLDSAEWRSFHARLQSALLIRVICTSDQFALLSGTISLTNYLSAATDGDTASCFPLKCQLSWASFAGIASILIDCNSCNPSFRCIGARVSQQGTRRRCATRRRCGRGTQKLGPASGWWPPLPATTACRGSATGASAPAPAFTCLSGCSPAHS